MIVKAHYMEAHEDFTLTNNLEKTIPHYVGYTMFPKLVEDLFTADPNRNSSLELLTEEYLFASGIPIIDEKKAAYIRLDADDITNDITSIQSFSKLFDNEKVVRLVCFGESEFAAKNGYYIIRYPSIHIDIDNLTRIESYNIRRSVTIFVDYKFLKDVVAYKFLKDNAANNTNIICELMENILYTEYESDVHINNLDTNDLMPYTAVDGNLNTNYLSTGVIVLPDRITWSTANFAASHVINLILNVMDIVTKEEIKEYLAPNYGKEWIFHAYLDDLLNSIYDTKRNGIGNEQEFEELYTSRLHWLAKKMLSENYELVENE